MPSFLGPVSYPVGSSPQAVALADFNGDGQLDLVVANSGSNTVSVLLGNGDGTFQAARNSATVSSPGSPAEGDFNGDGRLDLAVVDNGSVSILLGNGDGTFQSPQSVPIVPPPTNLPFSSYYATYVAVADINGDGKADLIVAGEYNWYTDADTGGVASYVSAYLGDGKGTFTPSFAYDRGEGFSSPITMADLNGDDKVDMVANNNGYVEILYGLGNGTFSVPQDLLGGGSGNVAVADFNGDGHLDLATAIASTPNCPSNGGNVLLGNGDGTFQPYRSYVSGAGPRWLAAADFNGDGKMDLVTVNGGNSQQGIGPSVNVCLGKGDGTFQPAQNYALTFYPNSVAVGDFNGDHLPDIAVAGARLNPDLSAVAVLINAADWSTTSQASSFTVSGFPSPTTAGVAGTFTVTAESVDGTTATDYRGTVHFRSSDSQAGLPADYTFTDADQGVHTFSAILKTAGTQALTATDTTSASVTGTDGGIWVNSAAAASFTVAGFPASVTAGVAGSFTVTARDPYGNRATGYTGTVHFTSSDAKAVLPGNYTFTAADVGMHSFSATLKTAGTQSLTAKDTVNAAIAGAQGSILVNAAAASRLVLSAPASVSADAPFKLTVTVVDAYGNVVTGYRATLAFSSSDATANLPMNYTFTAADHGTHTFTGLRLKKKGTQTLTVIDTLNGSLTGSAIIDVV